MSFSELPRCEQRRIENYELQIAFVHSDTSQDHVSDIIEIYQTINQDWLDT